MKKFIAFTLMLVLILACLAPAIAATAELTAMSHGGTAQTGYVKKTKTGDSLCHYQFTHWFARYSASKFPHSLLQRHCRNIELYFFWYRSPYCLLLEC